MILCNAEASITSINSLTEYNRQNVYPTQCFCSTGFNVIKVKRDVFFENYLSFIYVYSPQRLLTAESTPLMSVTHIITCSDDGGWLLLN